MTLRLAKTLVFLTCRSLLHLIAHLICFLEYFYDQDLIFDWKFRTIFPKHYFLLKLALLYRCEYIEMNFTIGNVSCQGCITNIENSIANEFGENGLIDASATLLTNKLCVRISPDGKLNIHILDVLKSSSHLKLRFNEFYVRFTGVIEIPPYQSFD